MKKDENFIPSSMLTSEERKNLLNVLEYSDLASETEKYEETARHVDLTFCPMNGGIGSTIKRVKYLKQIWSQLGRSGNIILVLKGRTFFLM